MNIKTETKIEIKHWTGRVLYTYQAADSSGLTMRHALEAASSSGAVLRGADLRGATIYGIKITRTPVCIDGLRWPVLIIDGHIKIGCQFHAISAWEAFDDAAIAAMDGWDALRFWRAHKDAIMALAAPFAVAAAWAAGDESGA